MAVALSGRMWGLSLLKRRHGESIRASRNKPSLLLALLLGVCLVALALLHVWLRLQVVRLGYVLSTTSKLQSQLEQDNRELKLELATLTSPDRLEGMSRLRLGMVEPERGQVVVLP